MFYRNSLESNWGTWNQPFWTRNTTDSKQITLLSCRADKPMNAKHIAVCWITRNNLEWIWNFISPLNTKACQYKCVWFEILKKDWTRVDTMTELMQPKVTEIRKHSSGDLHSRLKTRKLLGVGETDDGDVHRSKLSQILGHSDQLYIRLPPGLRIWQVAMAIIMTVMALWAFLFPRHLFTTMYEGEYENTLPIRLYGVALVCLSLMYWYTVNTVDKDMIRLLLLCSILFFTLHTIVSALCLPFVSTLCALPLLFLCVRLVCICVSVYFYWVFTRDWKISSKEHWRLYKQKWWCGRCSVDVTVLGCYCWEGPLLWLIRCITGGWDTRSAFPPSVDRPPRKRAMRRTSRL